MPTVDLTSTEGKLIAGMAGIPLAMLVIAVFIPWYGFAVSVLWRWFVVPLGAPEITWAHAAGLSLILGMSRARLEGKSGKPGGVQWAIYILWPAIAMAIGFILKSV